jgi:hypothetical protein
MEVAMPRPHVLLALLAGLMVSQANAQPSREVVVPKVKAELERLLSELLYVETGRVERISVQVDRVDFLERESFSLIKHKDLPLADPDYLVYPVSVQYTVSYIAGGPPLVGTGRDFRCYVKVLPEYKRDWACFGRLF